MKSKTSDLKFNRLIFCKGSGNKHWMYKATYFLAQAYGLQKKPGAELLKTVTAVKTLQIHQSKGIIREKQCRYSKTGFRHFDNSTEAAETFWNPKRSVFSQIQKVFQMCYKHRYMINSSILTVLMCRQKSLPSIR